MVERDISTILDARFVPKVGKYIVKLAFPDQKAKSYWMTRKQYFRLEDWFSITPKGYSDKHTTVIGVFSDEDYYMYSKAERRAVVREFIPPRQQDLSDLEDDL